MEEQTRTISWNDGEIQVTFDYQPAEKAVRYSDESGYPGCDEEFCINKVEYKGIDVTELFDWPDFNDMKDKIKEVWTAKIVN